MEFPDDFFSCYEIFGNNKRNLRKIKISFLNIFDLKNSLVKVRKTENLYEI